MERAAEAILGLGPKAVLVKGGHLSAGEPADDLFADAEGSWWAKGERIDTSNTHGTGCVLSAAITAFLAKGERVGDAVHLGKAFVTEAIRHSVAVGRGIGPVDPGWEPRGKGT
jgi:hydroxymethylpyrimidine/phosphomethylpyrimidine kinase